MCQGPIQLDALIRPEAPIHHALLYGMQSPTQPPTPLTLTLLVFTGDSGYNLSRLVMVPFLKIDCLGPHNKKKKEWNVAMSRARVAVEWYFGIVTTLFPFVSSKLEKRLKNNQRLVQTYFASALLTNIHNILNCNQISLFFSVPPPSLDDYLGI